MQDLTLLTIYQIAESWEKEVPAVPLRVWLHRMAKGMFPASPPPSLGEPFRFHTFSDGEKIDFKGDFPLLYETLETRCLDGTVFHHDEAVMTAEGVLHELAAECVDFHFPDVGGMTRRKINGNWTKGGDETLRELLYPVRIRRDHFHAWCEAAGYPLPHFWFGDTLTASQPPTEPADPVTPLPAVASPPATSTPEQIAADGRQCRKPDVQIAVDILRHYPDIGTRELGILVPANPGTNIEPESERKQGARLKQKALKYLPPLHNKI